MSQPRSRSPHYRRFPWEESNFDPCKVVSELDEDQLERSHGLREDPKEHSGYFRGVMYPEGKRRSPHSSDDRTFWHQRHPNQEDMYHRRSSPHYDGAVCDDRGISSPRDAGGDGDKRRGGFYSQGFENRGRIRDLSPSGRSDDQRGRRRNMQGPNRHRQREDSHGERNPPFKRHRRQMDDGFTTEEDFMDQHYLVDSPKDSFGGGAQDSLPHRNTRHSVGLPLVIEHDHGIKHGRKRFDDRRQLDSVFDRQRSPRPLISSQERLRTLDSRPDDREGTRGHHLQDHWSDYHESRSSPKSQDRTNSMVYGSQDGHINRREKGGPLSARETFGHGHGGRIGPHRNQPRLAQSSQGYQGPHEEQRQGYQPFRGENPNEGQPRWAQETKPQWKHDRPRSLDRHLFKTDVDPTIPRERVRGWTNQKNTTVEMEETLTIKVDTSQPINMNSSLCYSSDRQLSLDLVNVGRQRLDFLPMLEHSGTYQETAMHTGTFAQEIISLVHQVKEQYFRNAGITLNERFSAPPTGDHYEAETEELTLDQRFSSNRGFSLKMSSLLDDDEPLFSRLGSLQPVRGPGDLRHDLERKRQEKLEGVKVTISGNSSLQRPLASLSESAPGSRRDDELGLMEDERTSSWRREGSMGPRRETFHRPIGSQRRNHRFSNRLGQNRRQSPHNNPPGPRW